MQDLLTICFAVASILPLVQSVNMTFYDAQCGVDAGFGDFYKELLESNEDPLSKTTFTDFFASNGTLIVLDNVAEGADAILASRQGILPVDGSVRWNVVIRVCADQRQHFPNITFVAAETSENKTFQLSGIMHAITGGKCSTTYFSTQFTVAKDGVTGMANLEPRSGSLLVYDGFSIEGSADPCFVAY
ncbi:hypothetical protein DL98DRAFT_570103 [Cadophora sp. DSE1049]|nr:hypothetical protein DL98DRAFT_570103 [Cadophora sp. DSE1049]